MADLHADVAGRVRTADHVDLGVLQLGEGAFTFVDGYMHGGHLGQGCDAGLDVVQGLSQDIVCVCCQGSRAECGNENCLGSGFQGGHHAVRALDEGTPQTGLQQEFLDLGGVLGSLLAEVYVNLLYIGLYQNCQQFSLGTPHDFLHRTADRAGEENLGMHLVCHHRGTCLHSIALLHQQPGNQAGEVRGLHCNNVRRHGFDDYGRCNTLDGDVQTLLQSEIV